MFSLEAALFGGQRRCLLMVEAQRRWKWAWHWAWAGRWSCRADSRGADYGAGEKRDTEWLPLCQGSDLLQAQAGPGGHHT